jgi:hypothetical protein
MQDKLLDNQGSSLMVALQKLNQSYKKCFNKDENMVEMYIMLLFNFNLFFQLHIIY